MKIRLSNEQIEATKAFFMHYDWDWNTELIESEQRNNEDQSENFTPFISALEAGICDQCLCSPCVLDESNRQTWWPLDNMVAKEQTMPHGKFYIKSSGQCFVIEGFSKIQLTLKEDQLQLQETSKETILCGTTVEAKETFCQTVVQKVQLFSTWDICGFRG